MKQAVVVASLSCLFQIHSKSLNLDIRKRETLRGLLFLYSKAYGAKDSFFCQ